MRIQGRILRASNLAERRVLKTLGVDSLRVPRRANPFAVARHIKRLASGRGGDMPALKVEGITPLRGVPIAVSAIVGAARSKALQRLQ